MRYPDVEILQLRVVHSRTGVGRLGFNNTACRTEQSSQRQASSSSPGNSISDLRGLDSNNLHCWDRKLSEVEQEPLKVCSQQE